MQRLVLSFNSRNVTLFRHIDTVQKLTDILTLHSADLLDECRCEGDCFNFVAFEDNLVLDVLREREFDAGVAFDSTDDLFAQKVSDVDGCVLASWSRAEGQVNREVSVDGSHLVLVALGHADHHVLDVGADGTDDRKFFTVGEPSIDPHLIGLHHLDFQVGVTECTLELATGACDHNVTFVDGHSHALDDVNKVGGEDSPHLC